MRVTERTVLLGLTSLAVVAAAALAVASGELEGFNYPGSEIVWAVSFGAAGAIVTRTDPRQAVGRLLLWGGLAGASAQLVAQLGGEPSELMFLSFGLLVVTIGRFPDGDWVLRPAKWLAYLMVAAFVVQSAIWRLGPLVLAEEPEWVNAPFAVLVPASVAFLVVAIGGQIWLAWRGDATRRRQIAVVVFGGIVTLVIDRVPVADPTVADVLSSVTSIIFPVTIVIAVVRYRLYEIDRVVSRTISYAIVIGVMAAVYATVVAGLGLLVGEQGDLVVAIATLVAAGVSVPLVRRVRRTVDRRFFRYRYDAATVVARVADELRTTVDLAEVESRAESVIEEVFAPEAVGVWLAADG